MENFIFVQWCMLYQILFCFIFVLLFYLRSRFLSFSVSHFLSFFFFRIVQLDFSSKGNIKKLFFCFCFLICFTFFLPFQCLMFASLKLLKTIQKVYELAFFFSLFNTTRSQLTFSCSKTTIETLKKVRNMFKTNKKRHRNDVNDVLRIWSHLLKKS